MPALASAPATPTWQGLRVSCVLQFGALFFAVHPAAGLVRQGGWSSLSLNKV